MLKQWTLVACLSLAMLSPAFGQAGASDETFVKITADRDAYGRVVLLFGDSFARGFALGFFPDLATEEQRQNTMWTFRSPASTFNALNKTGAIAAYAGASGQPGKEGIEAVAGNIRWLTKHQILRPGDVAVFLDAGKHEGKPLEYLDHWLTLRRSVPSFVTTVMVTTPDEITPDHMGSSQAQDLYRYDTKFGGMSHNEATVKAANGAVLIDLNSMISPSDLQTDGIHLNITGQCIMVEEIGEAIGSPIDCPDFGN